MATETEPRNLERPDMELVSRASWEAIWHDLDVEPPEGVYEDLVTMYTEPHRYYHTITHVASFLEEIQPTLPYIPYPNLLKLAVWGHDAINQIGEIDNEERSAQYMDSVLSQAGLSDGQRKTVYELIMVTKHPSNPETYPQMLMVDGDLATFGKNEAFWEYEANIRKEYASVPVDRYCDTRAGILRQFDARKSLYNTDFFRQKYEDRAHENLQESIRRLELRQLPSLPASI